jgi:O-antigen/teichoic acid export membrane protein
VFAGGNLLSMVLRMSGGVLTARAVAPATLGLFNALGLVLGYLPFLQLGVLNGLNRELPFFVGQGKHDRVKQLAAAAQAWALIAALVSAGVLLGISGWYAVRGDSRMAVGWAANAVAAVVLFYGQAYLQVTFRTRGDFAQLSIINVIYNALGLLLVPLAWVLDFFGLCLRNVLVGVTNLALLWRWRPVKVRPAWHTASFWHLFRVGAPIFGVGQLYAWWTVLESTLVLEYHGTVGLGLYQPALLVGTAISLLSDAVTQITYPRMAEQYGRTGSLRDLLLMVRKPVLLLSLVSIPIIGLAWVGLPPLIQLVLPKYVEGIRAAQWMLLATYVRSLLPAVNVFNVVKRQDLYAVAIGLGIAAYVVGAIVLRGASAGLVGFAQATLIGRVVFIIVCYTLIGYLAMREARLRRRTEAASSEGRT